VGALGESAITMLANETIRSRKRPHLKQVAKWLRDLGLASAVDVSRIGTSDLFDISMTLSDGKSFPIADLGYGLSQILPVLVQCSFAPKDATLLFEQPEIHLHTISAAKLAKVFIETAKTKGAHVVLETHSPELVHAFMVAQRDEKTINPADLVVYRVDRVDGETRLKPIVFDEEFNVYENWRRGISE
jgi:predicted ATPase